MNILSIILGLLAAVFMFVGFIPLLGWLNWGALFVAAVGAIFGALSRQKAGLTICVVVIVIGGLRLFIGGGII
jgi:hypothetical protein